MNSQLSLSGYAHCHFGENRNNPSFPSFHALLASLVCIYMGLTRKEGSALSFLHAGMPLPPWPMPIDSFAQSSSRSLDASWSQSEVALTEPHSCATISDITHLSHEWCAYIHLYSEKGNGNNLKFIIHLWVKFILHSHISHRCADCNTLLLRVICGPCTPLVIHWWPASAKLTGHVASYASKPLLDWIVTHSMLLQSCPSWF